MSNIMWHVALEPGTTGMQDVILADLDENDLETIGALLSTGRLKGKAFETERGSYLLMYGGEYGRPYPSVMIWRIEIAEDESFIADMRQEDGWVLEHIWREWLMPEDTDAEYVPPEHIAVMQSRFSDTP